MSCCNLEGRGNGTNKMNKNVNLKLFFGKDEPFKIYYFSDLPSNSLIM